MREIHEWVIKPQLRNVAGVTEINSIGGFAREYQVSPNLEQMESYGLSLPDIVEALEKNNTNVGAGYIERNGEQYLIRAPGQVRSVQDIGDILVGTAQGERPIRIRDVSRSAGPQSDLHSLT